LCAQIKQRPHPALFVVGTSDSHHVPEKLAEAREATGGETLVIENADHSLEIKGDVVESVRALEGIIAGMQKLLG